MSQRRTRALPTLEQLSFAAPRCSYLLLLKSHVDCQVNNGRPLASVSTLRSSTKRRLSASDQDLTTDMKTDTRQACQGDRSLRSH